MALPLGYSRNDRSETFEIYVGYRSHSPLGETGMVLQALEVAFREFALATERPHLWLHAVEIREGSLKIVVTLINLYGLAKDGIEVAQLAYDHRDVLVEFVRNAQDSLRKLLDAPTRRAALEQARPLMINFLGILGKPPAERRADRATITMANENEPWLIIDQADGEKVVDIRRYMLNRDLNPMDTNVNPRWYDEDLALAQWSDSTLRRGGGESAPAAESASLRFIWEDTRLDSGDVRLHVELDGKLLEVFIYRDAVQEKYGTDSNGLLEAVINDKASIERAVVKKLRASPPDAVLGTSRGDAAQHFRIVLRKGDL